MSTIGANLARSTAIEMVASALRDPANFKQIDQVLAQYEPDPAAAELLIAAFEAGKAPAWLTACLLGRVGAKAGYATAQAIVLAAPGQLAEQYAAVAMIRIDREQALVDLAELLNTAPQRASREAAAAGLAEFGSTEAAELILAACLAQTIRLNIGGRLLGGLACDHAQFAELLGSQQAHTVRLALAVVKAMALNRNSDSRPAQCLIDAVAQALANSAISMAPQTRQVLLDWLERSTG